MTKERLTQKELDKLLESHKLWIESNGKEGERLDLCYKDCSNLNFKKANFKYSYLTTQNLKDIIIYGRY